MGMGSNQQLPKPLSRKLIKKKKKKKLSNGFLKLSQILININITEEGHTLWVCKYYRSAHITHEMVLPSS